MTMELAAGLAGMSQANLAQVAHHLFHFSQQHLAHGLVDSAAAEFSRSYCLQICAFLVPANLLATIQSLAMMAMERPLWERLVMAAAAAVYATIMVLHVATWFAAGVVMAPTYVLLTLAIVCLIFNGWAVRRAWQDQTVRRPSLDLPLSRQGA